MTEHTAPDRAGVVITGGGVAALECLMALRDLAPPELPITLVAPSDAFVYRPLQVAEPFPRIGRATRYPLDELTSDLDAAFVRDAVVDIRPQAREVRLRDGATLGYDTLVLAPGAQAVPAFEHAITFGQDETHEALHGLIADLQQGYTDRAAFVVPSGVTWTLPLYELALLTAHAVWDQGIDGVRLWLVTPEEAPLAIFGPQASTAVRTLLHEAGIEFIGSTYAEPRHGSLRFMPGDQTLAVGRSVALPILRGPAIPGVPADEDGFIPTDRHGRIEGLDGVYAAGDATTFPVKQGGLATQQADAVAETIAARLGAPVTPRPFRPVLRGMLFTGEGEQFLRHGIGGGEGEGGATFRALWWPPTKVAGTYLAPYLFQRDEATALHHPPTGFKDVELHLEDLPNGSPHGVELLALGRAHRSVGDT